MTNLPEIRVWHDHDGGPRPVPKGTRVDVKRRNGTLFFTTGGRSEDIDWSNVYSYYVVGYSPAPDDTCQHCHGTGTKPEPEPEPETVTLYGGYYCVEWEWSTSFIEWGDTHHITYKKDAEGNPIPGTATGPEEL